MTKLRILKFAACALIIALLASCSTMFDREYHIEQDYNVDYVETIPDSDIQEVRNYSGLRDAIENLVINSLEDGTIRTLNYVGDFEDDVQRAINYITRETPLGVYAVDYIRQDSHFYLTYYEIAVKIYYKVASSELESMVRFYTLEDMYKAIELEVSDFGYGFTFEVSASQLTEHQITKFVDEYYTNNSDVLTELPEITIVAYPHWNSIRKIITVSFKYSRSRESLLAERMIKRWQADETPNP